jgi:GNAT superfamily N-acetyltransferase
MGSVTFRPLTPQRWADFERLFGPRGACAGCWCRFWKAQRAEFDQMLYEGNRLAQKKQVKAGIVPGLLAYVGGEPVGWVAVEPRDHYARLSRSRTLGPVDDRQVWSITCFYVRRDQRGKGLMVNLVRAAIDYVKRRGGRIVEGYPVEPRNGRMPATSAYTGVASAFRRAGFREVVRRTPTRPILRYKIRG